MEAEFNHLNHATWECKYHVVFRTGLPGVNTGGNRQMVSKP
jgi:hypothetical protein